MCLGASSKTCLYVRRDQNLLKRQRRYCSWLCPRVLSTRHIATCSVMKMHYIVSEYAMTVSQCSFEGLFVCFVLWKRMEWIDSECTVTVSQSPVRGIQARWYIRCEVKKQQRFVHKYRGLSMHGIVCVACWGRDKSQRFHLSRNKKNCVSTATRVLNMSKHVKGLTTQNW